MDIEDGKLDCGSPDASVAEKCMSSSDATTQGDGQCDTRVIVQIKAGTLRGIIERLPNGGNMYVFKGIPYAQAPVGELRFKPPRPLEKLTNEILDCTQDGPGCYTVDNYLPNDRMSESCLYLNVYSPAQQSPKCETDKKLPVMIWIHGGGFVSGSAQSSMYNPKHLVQEGVVVVTVNYRLGPLGFLCLPSMGIYGNMGLKDQRMAFRWVGDNISAFGGDPNNVTIFGQSAGGASVHLHYLSEISRQYFHKVIAQSGTAFNQWVFQRNPEERSRKLATLLGCPSDDDDRLIYDTLMKASPKELTEIQYEVMSDRERNVLVNFPFTPVIEKPGSDDPVITDNHMNLVKQQFAKDIPIIMGITNEEGAGLANHVIDNMEQYTTSITDQLVPFAFHKEDNPNLRDIYHEIKQFFLKGEELTLNNVPFLVQILGDNANKYAGYQSAKLHSRFQTAPLYFYIFSYTSELNKMRLLAKTPENCPGAVHGDDLCYLFESSFFNTQAVSPQSMAKRRRMCHLWTNFAKFGEPSQEWPQIPLHDDKTRFVLKALEICDNLSVVNNPFSSRFDFWDNIFRKYGETQCDSYCE